MRNLPITFVSLLALSFIFSACSNQTTQKKEETPKDEMVMGDAEVTNDVPPPCPQVTLIGQNGFNTRRQAFLNKVQTEPNYSFPKGFHLCRGDAAGILSAASQTDELFAVIGYDENEDLFDLMFCIPQTSGGYLYYDFTQPCPRFCPEDNFPLPSTQPTLSQLNGVVGYYFAEGGLSGVLRSGEEQDQVWLMLRQESGGAWEQGIHLIDCAIACTYDGSGYFAACDGEHSCPQ